MMEVQPDVVIHDDLADDDGEAEEEEEEPRQRMEHPDDNGEFKNALYGNTGCRVFKRGYKIRKIFAQESTYPKEIFEF